MKTSTVSSTWTLQNRLETTTTTTTRSNVVGAKNGGEKRIKQTRNRERERDREKGRTDRGHRRPAADRTVQPFAGGDGGNGATGGDGEEGDDEEDDEDGSGGVDDEDPSSLTLELAPPLTTT